MEKLILEKFKKMLGKELEGLDLTIHDSENEDENGENDFFVMEKKDNGRVFDLIVKNGKIINPLKFIESMNNKELTFSKFAKRMLYSSLWFSVNSHIFL